MHGLTAQMKVKSALPPQQTLRQMQNGVLLHLSLLALAEKGVLYMANAICGCNTRFYGHAR